MTKTKPSVLEKNILDKAKFASNRGCCAYIFLMLIVFIISFFISNTAPYIIMAITIIGSIAIYRTRKKTLPKNYNEKRTVFKESFTKFPFLLEAWSRKISDKEIKVYLREMSKIADTINKKNPQAGEIFCMRHSSVLKLVEQYSEIESLGIKSAELTESLDRIEESIAVAQKAFVQELNNMFTTDMLHIDAETEAYMQSLKNRGLIE